MNIHFLTVSAAALALSGCLSVPATHENGLNYAPNAEKMTATVVEELEARADHEMRVIDPQKISGTFNGVSTFAAGMNPGLEATEQELMETEVIAGLGQIQIRADMGASSPTFEGEMFNFFAAKESANSLIADIPQEYVDMAYDGVESIDDLTTDEIIDLVNSYLSIEFDGEVELSFVQLEDDYVRVGLDGTLTSSDDTIVFGGEGIGLGIRDVTAGEKGAVVVAISEVDGENIIDEFTTLDPAPALTVTLNGEEAIGAIGGVGIAE